MKIFEFQLPVTFHNQLNPKLWKDEELLPEVRLKLLASAREFISFLKMENLPLRDIVITGSNTNLTYTDKSDLDLHIIVDMDKIYDGNDLVRQFFDSKRRLWNKTYDVTVRSIPVEVYVEDNDETVQGNAFSLMSAQWLKRLPLDRVDINERSVKAKYLQMVRDIKRALERADSTDDFTRLMKKIKDYRQSGLDRYGEFSTENLVFKSLRNNGWLETIDQQRTELVNKMLSLKEKQDIFV
jgi:hypothetical protein